MVWEVFYPGGTATERSTLQWAADHWHRDKTTRPTDFHSLEDLTMHSYRARIVAFLKLWIYQQAPDLSLSDSTALGTWLEKLPEAEWSYALTWLDAQLKRERKNEDNLNDHWNNHLRFCQVMEPYLTLCYAIKFGDIGLLRHAMREVCIIMQAPSAAKPKYARAMLRQLHIFDTNAADPVLQEAYLANSLVNLRGEGNTFYELNLLLEHQNGEFKRFRSDRGSSLQESDELFRLHALSVDSLQKLRRSMNKVIVARDRKGRHPEKDASLDILSLADQLHRSKSTDPQGPEPGKIYFSENESPNFVKEGLAALRHSVDSYNQSINGNEILSDVYNEEDEEVSPVELAKLDGRTENVNELFSSARQNADLTSDLSETLI